MNKLILVENLRIGKFLFEGYIVDVGDNRKSFCIYVDTHARPFIEFSSDLNFNITFSYNKEILAYINCHKTVDKKARKVYFKEFYNFIIESEKKASYMVFNKQKLNYIKNSTEIVELRNIYMKD